MDKITLSASKRKVFGRKANALRKKGILPANVFGKKIDSISIELPLTNFETLYKKAGETSLIELIVGDKSHHVLIANVQKNPVLGEIIHVDFHEVDLKVKVTATVPVELVGESPAEKGGIGTVVSQLSEIEVEALPMDLPEKFQVDVSSLSEVDQAIHAKDLDFDRTKVELKIADDQIIASVVPPQKEEVVEVAPTTEVIGEAPKEGEATAPTEEGAENKEESPKEAN